VKSLSIIGLGLMGGSLAMAVRRAGAAVEIRGFARRSETRRTALDMGIVDSAAADAAEAVSGADVVVFCLPVLAIPEVAAACRKSFKSGALVTDVGSTKSFVTSGMRKLLEGTGAVFVGSHPIAGSEAAGLDAARADLYDGAVAVVTPCGGAAASGADESAVRRICSLWEAVGSRVRVMSPEAHDRLLARTSHMPHLVAALLVDLAFGDEAEGTRDACGTGFRDATRMAAGSEGVWHDIVKTNADALVSELDAFIAAAADLRGGIASGRFEDVKAFLAKCRAIRAGLYRSGTGKSASAEGGADG